MMKLLGLSFELILAYWRWSLPQVPILEKVARNACEIHKNKLVDDKKNNLLFPDFLSAIQPETDGQGGIIIQGPVPVCPFAVWKKWLISPVLPYYPHISIINIHLFFGLKPLFELYHVRDVSSLGSGLAASELQRRERRSQVVASSTGSWWWNMGLVDISQP
jgi:hypothetical protein